MSTYGKISSPRQKKQAAQTDAWYGRGIYENQLLRIKNIVDTFGDRKPIAVSECGLPTGTPKEFRRWSTQKNRFAIFIHM